MPYPNLFSPLAPPSVPAIAYFALRPDSGTAWQIENLARLTRRRLGLTGRFYRADRLHVSLCSVGWRRDDIDAAIDAANRIRVGAFSVVFDTVSTFGGGGNTCLVLRCSEPIVGLDDLRDRLRSGLVRSGVSPGRPDFAAHITLVRPAPRVPEFRLDQPVGWVVRDFVLALKGRGRRCDLGRWTCG